MGRSNDFDLDELYDSSKSLSDGALTIPGYTGDGWYVRIMLGCGFLPPEKPIKNYTKKQLHDLLYKEPTKVKVDGVNFTYEGLIPKIQKSMLSKDVDAMQPHIRRFVERAVIFTECAECDGTRLAAPARSSLLAGQHIGQVSDLQVTELLAWLDEIDAGASAPLVGTLTALLTSMVEIGLGYLSLNRPTGTLSGGESQRVKMVRHLGSALTDVTYVFDEPTIGLHPHDIATVNALLLSLRDKGNTVLVVEHKPEVIAIADHVVDVGPGAGTHGGEVCFEGGVAELAASSTVTGRHLQDRAALNTSPRTPTGHIQIRGASTNNLRNVDVDIPTGVLVVVTGVAGSGKSSLVHGHVGSLDDVAVIDQTSIKGSRRSNPATYTGMLDPLRKAMAKATGQKPALFSPNSDGACPSCNGAGMIYTEVSMMETVASTCDECEGRRFSDDVLEHTFGGKNIAEILALPSEQAADFFASPSSKVPAAHKITVRLRDVGLGYVTLGQPLTTLSGGERQRLKLAVRMGEKASTYVLDEPTTGLHLADVDRLLHLLDALVDGGTSVVVIEHHQAVMAHADWIIDIGPGAGHDGGRVVFQGTPAQLVADATTLTGKHLADYVAG